MRVLFFLFILTAVEAREVNFSFLAKTNMPGITVEGKTLKPISFGKENKGSLVVDIKNITTEMELRDEHMREEIFQNKNVQVDFEETTLCKEKTPCDVKLKISINNKAVEKVVNFQKEGNGLKAELTLSLKEFAIKEPSKFGVKVLPEIGLKINVKN